MGKFDDPPEELPSQAELAAQAEALHWFIVASEKEIGLEYLRFLLFAPRDDKG